MKAFIVVGAESSGTRLLSQILVSNGVSGEATHQQKFDTEDPSGDVVVWRRSVPHGLTDDEPDLVEMGKKLKRLGYSVTVLVMHRDPAATLASQEERFLAITNRQIAEQRYQAAYLHIYSCIKKMKVPFYSITYESLVSHQKGVLNWLSEVVGLQLKPIAISDENAKRYPSSAMYPKLTGALCTQATMETQAYKDICLNLLKERPSFHRKQWEFAYIIDMLRNAGKFEAGMKGLGFGCGKERLAAALAAQDMDLLLTDLSFEEAKAAGWVDTNQHAANLEGFRCFCPDVCSEEQLSKLSYQNVDMNHIPQELMRMGFDFVWSSCALEHVGSLALAKQFILSTIHCLKPGGVAIHTTEFNLSSDAETLHSGPTVLFRKQDILWLKAEAEKIDGILVDVDFDPGDRELDQYIDLPPYLGNEQRRHLKLQVGKYDCTSIGICIRRKL
jgi:SAM-dependent methyltransferase